MKAPAASSFLRGCLGRDNGPRGAAAGGIRRPLQRLLSGSVTASRPLPERNRRTAPVHFTKTSTRSRLVSNACQYLHPKNNNNNNNWVLSFKWNSVYFHFLSLLNKTKPKLRVQGAGRGRVPGGRGLVADLRAVQRQQRDLLQTLGPLPAPQIAPPPYRQLLQQPPQARGAPAAALLGRRPGPHVPGLIPARTAGRAPREEPPPAPAAQAGAAVAGRAPSLRLGLGERWAAPLQARHPLQQPVPCAAAPGAAGPRVRHAGPGPLLRTSAPGGGRGPRLGNPRAGRLCGGLKTRKGRSSPFCRLPECAPRPSPVGVAKETRTLTPQCLAEASAPGTERKPPAPASEETPGSRVPSDSSVHQLASRICSYLQTWPQTDQKEPRRFLRPTATFTVLGIDPEGGCTAFTTSRLGFQSHACVALEASSIS